MNLVNLKLFFRKTVKDKFYFIINTLGLSIGIATVLILFFWVMYEFNYDRFHENYNNIYLASNEFEFSKGVVNKIMETPGPLAGYLQDNFPEIKKATTCQKFFADKYIINDEKKFLEKGYAVSPSFFDIFSIDFVSGDKISSFESLNSIAISESLAIKLFNSNTPIGEKVKIDDEGDFFVSAVFKDIPNNSSIKFDYLLTMSYIENLYNDLELWEVLGYTTFILLNENTDVNILNDKIKDVLVSVDFGEISKRVVLTPLKDFHFDTNFGMFIENPGDIKNTYILILLACFILIVSVVNYINLSIARSELRLKEIGVKQTFGVNKIQLIKQFFTESFFFTCFVSVISMIIVFLTIPKAQFITGKMLLNSYIDFRHIIGILGIIGITAIMASLYPSFYLSSLKPLDSAKNHVSRRTIRLRKVLALSQFVLVIFVSLCVFTIYNQVNYMLNKDLGYKKQNLLRFNLDSKVSNSEIHNELLKNPDIQTVARTGQFTNVAMETGGWDWNGNTINNLSVFTLPVGKDFIKTINGEFITGNDFSENEDSRLNEVIINESAMKFMGIEDCIGMSIKIKENEYKVVGVVNDFHYTHLKYKIKPLLILYDNNLTTILVRLGENKENTIKYIEDVYNKFNTSIAPFSYSFIEDDIVTLYGDENQLKKSITGFLFVLLFVSVIAMIGMMASHTSQKNKEIGIRKVFGAQGSHIVIFLLKDIIKLVLIAYIIATPFAIFIINKWLNGFANHVSIDIIPFFIIAILFIVFIILILFYQSFKASKMSPVKVLQTDN